MRKRVLTALGVALLASGMPARAAQQYGYVGGCDITTARVAGSQDYEGAVTALAVLYGPAAEPVTGTLGCEVRVNGAAVADVSATGTTVLAQAGRVTYAAADTDYVELCETVTTPGWTSQSCEAVDMLQVPPQAVLDMFEMAVDLVESVVMGVDATTCPVLAQLSGTYGPVVVNSEGDVFLSAEPMWDCPPYDVGVLPPIRRLPPPMYYQGGIAIANHGAGTAWQATGLLANPRLWSCARDTSMAAYTVVCDWLGGLFPPVCRNGAATAVALPTYSQSSGGLVWGRVRTRTLCIGNWLAELVEAGPATGAAGNQFHFHQRPLSYQYGWQVQCQADDGASRAPRASYVAECDFLF